MENKKHGNNHYHSKGEFDANVTKLPNLFIEEVKEEITTIGPFNDRLEKIESQSSSDSLNILFGIKNWNEKNNSSLHTRRKRSFYNNNVFSTEESSPNFTDNMTLIGNDNNDSNGKGYQEMNGEEEEKKMETLRNMEGPAPLSDTDSILNGEAGRPLHVRVKRGAKRNKENSLKFTEEKRRTKRNEKKSFFGRNRDEIRELKYFDDVREPEPSLQEEQPNFLSKKNIDFEKSRGDRAAKTFEEIKELADRLAAKVNEFQVYLNLQNGRRRKKKKIDLSNSKINSPENEKFWKTSEHCKSVHNFHTLPNRNKDDTEENSQMIIQKNRRKYGEEEEETEEKKLNNKRDAANNRPRRIFKDLRILRSRNRRQRSRKKWDRWTDWTGCSVTCGKGRQIRWRHCIRDCNMAETEMEEKSCQLPACPPGKFLGIF